MELLLYPKTIVVVHGMCRGADRLAAAAAKMLGIHVEGYPADWERFGRAAGPIRNKQMLDTGINLVLCFHNDMMNSKGTKNTMMQAMAYGIEVKVITSDGSIPSDTPVPVTGL